MKRLRLDPVLSLAALGLASVSLGVGIVFPPAFLIVAGSGLLAYAVFLAPDKKGGPTT